MIISVSSRSRSGLSPVDWGLALLLTVMVGLGAGWLIRTQHQSGMPVLEVGVAAGLTALTTGFGTFPFLFFRNPSRIWVGAGHALAAGLMAGASIRLALEGWQVEGVEYSPIRLLTGVALGVLTVWLADRALSGKQEMASPEILKEGVGLRRLILVVGVMTVHSFAEGVGVGVSYGDGNGFGDFIALSIAVHNIPEGLAISLVLVPAGTSVRRAMGWSVFSSLPQPLVAIPSFIFVLAFRPFLPVGLGLAAGAMVWMVLEDLLPEARKYLTFRDALALAILGAGGMMGFQYLL